MANPLVKSVFHDIKRILPYAILQTVSNSAEEHRKIQKAVELAGVDVDDLTSAEAGEMADPLALDANPMTQDLLAGPGTDPAPFLKRLGPVPFWRGEVRCLDALGKIYSRVHPVAMEAAQGKSIDLR